MVLIELIDSLEDEIKYLFRNREFESKNNKYKSPRVSSGWYGFKDLKGYMASNNEENTLNPDEEFPYILISPVNQKSTGDESDLEILFICAGHSFDKNGWKDPALMAERIRRFLLEKQTIKDRFEIDRNISIEFPDNQPYPEWFVFMNAKFKSYEPVNLGGIYSED